MFVRNFEGRVRMPSIGRDRTLEACQSIAFIEFKRANLVVKAGIAFLEPPAHRRRGNARRARQDAADPFSPTREADADGAPLVRAERIAERRARRLPHARSHSASRRKSHFREVRMMNIT